MVSIYRLKPDSREQHCVLGPQHPHVTQPTPMSLRNSLIITPARHQGEWGVSCAPQQGVQTRRTFVWLELRHLVAGHVVKDTVSKVCYLSQTDP